MYIFIIHFFYLLYNQIKNILIQNYILFLFFSIKKILLKIDWLIHEKLKGCLNFENYIYIKKRHDYINKTKIYLIKSTFFHFLHMFIIDFLRNYFNHLLMKLDQESQ